MAKFYIINGGDIFTLQQILGHGSLEFHFLQKAAHVRWTKAALGHLLFYNKSDSLNNRWMIAATSARVMYAFGASFPPSLPETIPA